MEGDHITATLGDPGVCNPGRELLIEILLLGRLAVRHERGSFRILGKSHQVWKSVTIGL